MISEVVRKHLLKDRKLPLNDDDLEIAIHVGWKARDEEIERLKSENARYREALEFTTDMLKASQIWVTSYGVRHDSEKAIQKANEALKGGE